MRGKLSNNESRQKVYELCETLGFWNVRPLHVEKELGIPNQNVSRWKKDWIKKHGVPNISAYGKELNVNGWVALQALSRLMLDKDKKLRVSAASTYFQAVEKFGNFLEQFNYKSKVPELTNIELKWKENKKQ